MKKETIIALALITLAACFFIFGSSYLPEYVYRGILGFLAGWQVGSWCTPVAKYLSEKF